MDNPVLEWLGKDKGVCEMLVRIDETNLSANESGSLAFHRISDYLLIPKTPSDINKQHFDEHAPLNLEPRSVIEELAILNYLAPEDDIRGKVLCAIHNMYFKAYTDWNEVTLKRYHYSTKTPESYSVYLFGNGIDARLQFDIEKGSWVEAGALAMYKIIVWKS